MFPASDLSEQISTAGKEASGTGNNEICPQWCPHHRHPGWSQRGNREAVGADNFFLFGLTAEQVAACKAVGHNPWFYYDTNPELKRVMDMIASGLFSPSEPDLFLPLLDSLLVDDPFMVMADYAAYIQCQEHVSRTYEDQNRWTRMSILNAARIGRFSADRTISEYAQQIWQVGRCRWLKILTTCSELAHLPAIGALMSQRPFCRVLSPLIQHQLPSFGNGAGAAIGEDPVHVAAINGR